jgi:hypothetical protein
MQIEETVFIEKELMSAFFEDQFRGKVSSFHQSGIMKVFSVRSLQLNLSLFRQLFELT